jgi:hypothetical protein
MIIYFFFVQQIRTNKIPDNYPVNVWEKIKKSSITEGDERFFIYF